MTKIEKLRVRKEVFDLYGREGWENGGAFLEDYGTCTSNKESLPEQETDTGFEKEQAVL